MRGRTFLKLFGIFLVLILLTTFLVDFSVRRVFQQTLEAQIQRDLESKARLVAIEVEHASPTDLAEAAKKQSAAARARVTVIDAAGVVLADSEADSRSMENHATRSEFASALRGGTGVARRTSATTNEPYLYVAVPLRTGAVRLAYPLVEIQRTISQAQRNLIIASLVVLPLVALLAAWIAHSIVGRVDRVVLFAEEIAGGNFEARIRDDARDELAQATAALNRTAERLRTSFEAEVRSREQIEAVLNSMQEAVIAVGPDRKVLWANGQMNRMLAGGVRPGALLSEVSRDPELINAVQVSLEDKSVSRVRLQMAVPGRVFIATVAPIADSGVVAVLHEITEIERVEKTRRDFIANVSHELRTPLTSIRGYAETLLDFPLDASTKEFVEIIKKNAMRMVRLTEDLLVLARVESGEEVLRLERTAASRLAEDAFQNYRELARSRGHVLTSEISTDATVNADQDKILQVFINLLENAVKYSREGSEIFIGAREAGASVEFFVRDAGQGIPSAHLSRLFERFYRVDKARSIESGSTGLGLAIVKHIVLKHGGTVRAESELNRGSSFIFTLPKA